jgi:hypothetical protein
MKTNMKRLFADASSAIAIVLLAVSFTIGGSHAVRADDLESPALSAQDQDTVLMPVKDLEALQQRVLFLEEAVTALTESWQHINTHRLCVSDDREETCITKPQLEALLMHQAPVAQISPSPAVVGVESVAVATVIDNAEPAPSPLAGDLAQADEEPEHTGSITPRVVAPEVDTAQEPESAPLADQP